MYEQHIIAAVSTSQTTSTPRCARGEQRSWCFVTSSSLNLQQLQQQRAKRKRVYTSKRKTASAITVAPTKTSPLR